MRMKLIWLPITISFVVFFIFGCVTKPPTAFEQRMFNIQTNYVPVVEFKTNVVPVTVPQTNYLMVTNVAGVTEYHTNVVPVTVFSTNVVAETRTNEAYVYSPGAGATQVRQVGTEVGNVFGVGGIVGTALGAVFSLWGYVRSKKTYVTAANIAQTVETMREFIKSLPNGQVMDKELVNWMVQNQANAGVLQNVVALISNEVSRPDAKDAAEHVKAIIEGLRIGTTPPPPSAPSPLARQ